MPLNVNNDHWVIGIIDQTQKKACRIDPYNGKSGELVVIFFFPSKWS